MATPIGAALPDDLYDRLRGPGVDALPDRVIQIVTVDDAGWPHPAMLSYLEVAAPDRRNVRLATYTDSRTTGNMRRTGKATLAFIDTRMVYYVKGTVAELAARMACAPENAKLNLAIEQVLVDLPDPQREPGAYVSSGVTYFSPNRADALARGRRIVQELLS